MAKKSTGLTKAKKNQPVIPLYVEDWLKEKIEKEQKKSVKKREQQEKALELQFKDLRGKFDSELKKMKVKFPDKKTLARQIEKGLEGDWVTDKKFQADMEKYGMPIRDAMFKAGYKPEEFQKQLLAILNYPNEQWTSFGLGCGFYQGPSK
jgi:hypothetical protein